MTTVVCVDCGQADSKDRMLKAPRGFVHIFNKYCEKAWQTRAEAAERRVAELEARVEQEWLPVTEKPKKSGRYLVWNRQYPQFEPECQFFDISTASWYTNDADALSVDFPTHWRPLPPPPAATE